MGRALIFPNHTGAACPTCGAPVGGKCRDDKGRLMHRIHAARRMAAGEVVSPPPLLPPLQEDDPNRARCRHCVENFYSASARGAHERRCATATPAEREYYRRHRMWPPTTKGNE